MRVMMNADVVAPFVGGAASTLTRALGLLASYVAFP
jgi:hypothetical protein